MMPLWSISGFDAVCVVKVLCYPLGLEESTIHNESSSYEDPCTVLSSAFQRYLSGSWCFIGAIAFLVEQEYSRMECRILP